MAREQQPSDRLAALAAAWRHEESDAASRRASRPTKARLAAASNVSEGNAAWYSLARFRILRNADGLPVGVWFDTGSTQFEISSDVLTVREVEVIILATRDGLSETEIGETLGISHHTVKSHRSRIYKKLRIRSLGQLGVFAVKAGLV
jgi:DNA-binding NarL/FixJ family response regulator